MNKDIRRGACCPAPDAFCRGRISKSPGKGGGPYPGGCGLFCGKFQLILPFVPQRDQRLEAGVIVIDVPHQKTAEVGDATQRDKGNTAVAAGKHITVQDGNPLPAGDQRHQGGKQLHLCHDLCLKAGDQRFVNDGFKAGAGDGTGHGDKLFVFQFTHIQHLPVRQGMIQRQRHTFGKIGDHQAADGFIGRGAAGDHGVRRFFLQGVVQLIDAKRQKLQRNIAVAVAEQVHKVCNIGFKVIPLKADPHAADLPGLGGTGTLADPLKILEQLLTFAGEDLPGGGEGDAVGGALQQCQLQLLLQRGDGPAERRLGDKHGIGSLGKIQGIGQSAKAFQLKNRHSCIPPSAFSAAVRYTALCIYFSIFF